MSSTLQAVFVDRDGVLNRYLPGDYVTSPSELELLPGIADAIRHFNDAGLKVAVISNQQGVGKGIMTQYDLDEVSRELERSIGQISGAFIDRQYYCTDLKESGSDRRKPKPGMLYEAAEELGLELEKTVFVGDSETDIVAARAAGVGHVILVLTGATDLVQAGSLWPAPDLVLPSLVEASEWILEQ